MRDLQLRNFPLIVVAVGRNLLVNVKLVLHQSLHRFVHRMAR
jgi:hypothetical protein